MESRIWKIDHQAQRGRRIEPERGKALNRRYLKIGARPVEYVQASVPKGLLREMRQVNP